VHIPESINDPADPPLSPVSGEVITLGSKKIFLEWVDPTNSSYKGTKVFLGSDNYPNVSLDQSGKIQTDGTEIVDTTVGYFAHRILGTTNRKPVARLSQKFIWGRVKRCVQRCAPIYIA
jgi:hypothetical protein